MIIQELESVYSVAKMARYLGVTRQSYWRWKRRQSTRFEMEDEVLKALILKEFEDNKKRYGYRRVSYCQMLCLRNFHSLSDCHCY